MGRPADAPSFAPNLADWLQGISHVVVDEVHERTMQGDFLLAVLRDLVSLRESIGQPLKVVLMSATLDAGIFSSYFDCPVLTTEGRTFPVEHHFLEDVKFYD
ncbi:hypothetical protein BSKO_10926 [Bryopsis sp. KO-2023]|nr:hypothetical protein BSKO_10926 [Bryopsis sp. KO-2023]